MEKLKQILSQEDTVLFIGSGLSVWSGLPSWPALIEELARFLELSGVNADLVRAEALRGDLLQAASYGFDKLTKQQIGDFIRSACRYGAAKPHEIHKKVVSLGPRCFVTTNYDNLIEEALRLWRPDRFFRSPITNRHLTETAEIVHARAIDFIFKPHGDAGDSESIILTREQYRQLLPQGEKQNALESLKLLLASRPVVYLGFGLRDPDFLYVRDLLANTYKGGTRDHYAIMPDISAAESDYWRGNYGIHLDSYDTMTRTDGTKDHSALLCLLDSFLEAPSVTLTSTPLATANVNCAPDVVLSLARHAARLTRAPKLALEFPIRVHADDTRIRNEYYYRFDKFDHSSIEQFLDSGPDRALLVGLPGAGKTYALRRSAARFAEKLNEICLSEPFDESAVMVPLFVDLKLYHGNLAELVSQTLPKSLPFDELRRRFRTKIILDSFNEMPREYWESGSYEGDFARFVASIGDSSLIIGSRTTDGLVKLGFPAYCLDQIDDAVVDAELQKMNIDLGGRFDAEVRQLLQKPFYFQLLINRTVTLPKEAHPRDFYVAYFASLRQAFTKKFSEPFDIEDALCRAAYDAINRGEEAYPLAELLRTLKISIDQVALTDIDSRDVANWLVSTLTLIPYIGGRIAFVHQSITEYLAAKELARRYQADPQILKEKLSLTRWDQALFLTLSILPEARAKNFFDDVVNTDFSLALSAVKYLEFGRDEIISKLLARIPKEIKKFGPFESRIEWILETSLPLSELHEPQLRALMNLGGSIGAAAVKRLITIKGSEIKEELLQVLVDARSDYNFCANGIGPGLKPLATPEDVTKVALLADSISLEVKADANEEKAHGFICGSAAFLQDLDISVIRYGLMQGCESDSVPEIRLRILCDILRDRHSTEALNVAGELLLHGVERAATTMYFIAHFAKPEHVLSWTSFRVEHLDGLVAMADDSENDSWALRALKCLCLGRPDLAEIIKIRSLERVGISRAALLYCATPDGQALIFEALGELANMSSEQRKQEATHLIKYVDIDWVGHETLFVRILRLRDSQLALAILDQVHGNLDCPLGQMEIGPIEWWLDWLTNESDPDIQFVLEERISWLFSLSLSKEARSSFVTEFNKPDSKYRSVLARSFLLFYRDLTTDDFSEDAISFLLADLTHRKSLGWHGHLLGKTATEQFVAERLLPLLPTAKGLLRRNLEKVLRDAGSRHGRRYIVE